MPKGQSVLCPNDPSQNGKGLKTTEYPGVNEEASGRRQFEA